MGSPADIVAIFEYSDGQMKESRRPSASRSAADIKRVSLAATYKLAEVIAPALQAKGVSFRQFSIALRHAMVHQEASKVAGRKINKARIAFATGLTRGEVARYSSSPHPANVESDIDAILSLWRHDSRFMEIGGEPSVLTIFGRRKSFEQIVKLRGKGLPIRAILDELVARGAVSLLPHQNLRLEESWISANYGVWDDLMNQLRNATTGALNRARPSQRLQRLDLRRKHLKRV